MSDPFIGEIRLFPYSFAPAGWAWCNGQKVGISNNPALNAVIGATWGGDQKTYFLLPKLDSQIVVGTGSAPNDSSHTFTLGMTNQGAAGVTLNSTALPSHSHLVNAKTVTANYPTTMTQAPVAGSSWIGRPITPPTTYYKAYNNATQDSVLNPAVLGPSSATTTVTAHENRQPFAYVPMCIALTGIFPVRS